MSDEVNKSGIDLPQNQASNPSKPGRIKGFFGAYNHSVDAKGRMIVPQSFRELLGEEIVIGINRAQNSIAIYPYEVWAEEIDFLSVLREQDARAEKYLDRFARFSFDNVTFDSQGRVLLPAALREIYLKNATGVQVSGARYYVKVVSSQQAAEEARRFEEDEIDVLSELSNMQ